mgnify:FL=1
MSSTPRIGFTRQHRRIGRAAAWGVFFLGMAYAITTALGLLSLESPQEPIGDPYFSVMELLILVMAPLLVVSMVAVHAYAASDAKAYSLTALVFVLVLAGITSSVHFVVLTVGRHVEATGLAWVPLFFSFEWPSVVYALDVLAWDWFFALSLLFAAPAFEGDGLERAVRTLLVVGGVLSLVGLVGVPIGNMQVRNVGVVGYAVVAPVAFLLMGIVFGRAEPARRDVERSLDAESTD